MVSEGEFRLRDIVGSSGGGRVNTGGCEGYLGGAAGVGFVFRRTEPEQFCNKPVYLCCVHARPAGSCESCGRLSDLRGVPSSTGLDCLGRQGLAEGQFCLTGSGR